MTKVTRRRFLAGTATAAAAAGVATTGARAQEGAASVSVEEALRARRSVRRFGPAPLEQDELLRVLWAAAGVNREGDEPGYTAPAWRSARAVDLYVATEEGVHRYDPAEDALEEVLGEDIRDRVSSASFIQRAPAVLIYVSDRDRLVEAAGEEAAQDEQALAIGAHVNSAVMAQNVYLFAAAEGLGTVLIGGTADKPAIAEALSLTETQTVTYIQPVGVAR